MALATIALTPTNQAVQGGTEIEFNATASGALAVVGGTAYSWQNENGCTEDGNGRLTDSAGGGNGYGASGATMATATIEEGIDGYAEFIAAVAFAEPEIGYPEFGGALFFAGLTTASAVLDKTDFLFAIEVTQGGVAIYEQGVLKANPRAPRNGGRYKISVEGGKVVYYADDQVIYRSDLDPEFPLLFGAIFYHRGTDAIGGNASSSFTYTAFASNGDPAGSWVSNTWTAPNTRGRYRIVAQGADYLFAETFVDVLETFPNEENTPNFPLPSKTVALLSPDDFKVNEQILDDQAAVYCVPLPDAQPVRRWQLEFTGMSNDLANVLDQFVRRHKGRGFPFYYFDSRYRFDGSESETGLNDEQLAGLDGDLIADLSLEELAGLVGYTWDNCRIERYEVDHRRLHSNSQSRRVTIVRRPV